MNHYKKLSYSLEILYNKWAPFIISGLLLIYHTLNFLFPWDLIWIEYLCLPSIFTALHMYNSRHTFMLCKVHRCFVNYTVANILVCIAEHYWLNPFMNIPLFIFIISGTFIAMLLGLIYYTQEHAEINSRNALKNSR